MIVCGMLIFFLLPWRTLELLRSGVSTQGMVAGRLSCNAGLEGGYQAGWILKIAYTDQAGSTRTFLTFCSSEKPAPIGSYLAVRYLPTGPADLEENIASGVGSAIAVLAFGFLLLGGMLFGVYQRVVDHVSLYHLSRTSTKRS